MRVFKEQNTSQFSRIKILTCQATFHTMPAMYKTCLRFILHMVFIALTVFCYALPVRASQVSQAEALPLPPLMISEVQTGGLSSVSGSEDGRMEFIELYNPSETPIDVTDWRIDYLSASHTGSGPPTRTLVTLRGVATPKSFILLSYDAYLANADEYFGIGSTSSSGLLAKSGGQVQITNNAGQAVDLLTWGTAARDGWWEAPEIPAGLSVQRILPNDPLFTNGVAFTPPAPPTPQGGGWQAPEALPELPCRDLIISELLPNPAGADGGHEFIELHNPTNAIISMQGCKLRLGETGKTFTLPDAVLAAGAYHALWDTDTGIVLPNATAQTVWMVASGNESGILYPDAMSDDQAWAFIEGTWQVTLSPTPGNANMLQSPIEQADGEGGGVVLAAITACAAGKERNPETNRCRNIPAEEKTLAPCKTGQERNPATLRCRSITSTASAVTSCKPGQTRNPSTNRCRSIQVAKAAMKPCPAGQERNTQTNRCRKTSGDALAKVQDVKTDTKVNPIRWWLAGLVAAGALGYAVYEWRQEITQSLKKLKQKLRRGSK